MKKVSIIIPALNEEKAIAKVIKAVPINELKKMNYSTEILVIDNGSTDKTSSIAKKSGATVMIQPVIGYGNAYKAGFANATGDIIATGDADMTYPFEDIPKLVKMIKDENLDFINTDRLTNLNPEAMHWTHQFGNWFLAAICRTLWKFPFKDSQSGMWVFKRNILSELNVKSSGMPFSQELKIEVCKNGFKCKEVKIDYRARIGDVKLRGIRDAVGNTLHLFKKRIRG